MHKFIVLFLGCLMLTNSCNGSMEKIVGELQQEIQQLKLKTASYENEVQVLKTSSAKEIQDLKTSSAKEIQDLKTSTAKEIQDLKTSSAKEIQMLKSSVTAHQNEIQALKISSAKKIQALHASSASNIQAFKTSSAKEIKFLKEEINALKNGSINDMEALKLRFVLDTNSFAEKPAFTAALSNHIYDFGNNQPIVFDAVFTNNLNGYSSSTGVFTTPIDGIYFFTATVMSHTGTPLETAITLNGNTLVYMYSSDSLQEQGTNSVVLVLNTGDKVWIRHYNDVGTRVYGNYWSTFSGFMI